MEFNWKQIDKLINMAFAEDLGDSGDITTNTIIPDTSVSNGFFMSKDVGIVAGIPIVERCFKHYDDEVKIEVVVNDGERVLTGGTILRVNGKTRSLLAVERVALNFLGHLSGIATLAGEVVKLAGSYGAMVLDTRKTTPGFRELEKYAAKAGGIVNHRMGLYDGLLVKENHIRESGSIKEAVKKLNEIYPGMSVEVEVEDLEQLRQAIAAGANVIMLDNIMPRLMRKAAKMMYGDIKLEASGGITLDNVAEIAATGVQRISMGQITAGASRLDVSFLID